MHDDIRRLIDQQEEIRRLTDPLREVRGLMEPFRDPYGGFGIGHEIAALFKEENERRRLFSAMPDISGAVRISEELEAHRRLFEGPVSEAKRLGLLDPAASIRNAVDEALAVRREYEELFRLPVQNELEKIAREFAQHSALAKSVFDDSNQLRLAMAAMKSPWLQVSNDAASAAAFADMVAMGRGIETGRAFELEFGSALRMGLGDWRDPISYSHEALVDPVRRLDLYTDRGFDSDLTDFTPAAFDQGARIAGLRESEPEDGVAEDDEEGFQRARIAFERLNRFEVSMRRFITRAMETEFGPNWMRSQLPKGMLEDWISKRDRAVEAGQPEHQLIDYADFTEYRSIIERKDNWRLVFRPVFRRVEDVRESFQRLFPVRIATMHSRLITLDDDMLLLVETKRMMKAIAGR